VQDWSVHVFSVQIVFNITLFSCFAVTLMKADVIFAAKK
jgi:hypothetical protein